MDGSRVFDDSTGLEGAVAGARIEALPRRDLKVAISTISFGFEPYAFFDGHNRVSTFSARPDRNDLPDLIDVITRGQDDGHVLAVYPAWQREPALQKLQIAGSALGACRLMTFESRLPPLAGAVFVSLASAVSPYMSSAGALVASLPALERELLAIAWVGSVTGLSSPGSNMFQHVASLWPSTSFAVYFWPRPAVRLLGKKKRAIPIRTTYRPMRTAVAAREKVPWVEDQLLPALGSSPPIEVAPTPLGHEWWGTDRLVEVVSYPVDIPVTARIAGRNLSHRFCRWCGEPVASEGCPFCGVDLSEQVASEKEVSA
jgi:hypothetical protein